jgi:type IV pilus assembly protein PilA
MRMFKKDEGFTLVELMVVVLIIGILVAVAIPVFNSASASARKRACQANLRTLDGAVEQWASANPSNDKLAVDNTVDAWKAKLDATDAGAGLTGTYVKDWATSTKCPADNTIIYGVSSGTWSCGYTGAGYPHRYTVSTS